MRVLQFLSEQQIDFEPLIHPPAYTAQRRAKYLRVSGKQVAKTLLLVGPDGYLVAILPATHIIDWDLLSRALGGPVRLATAQEIGKVFPDCEWGVVPPFGALYGLPTIMDESLLPESCIVFEANTHAEAIRMTCSDFERLERPRRLRFSRSETLTASEQAAG
jgi:Ala-tRNA(Pro) deacylase